MDIPSVIEGGIFKDSRGEIRHVNDFNFDEVKRFYIIHQKDSSTVRAWQGHKIEKKYFYVLKGAFLFAWVRIDKWNNPSPDLKSESIVLSGYESKLLYIPGGFANGIKAVEDDSILLVYSNLSLEDSQKDIMRFDKSLWFDWNREPAVK